MTKKVNIRFRKRELTVYFDTIDDAPEQEICNVCQEQISAVTLIDFIVMEGNKTLPIKRGTTGYKVVRLLEKIESEAYDLCHQCMLDRIYELTNSKDCSK